ncbi:MAG: hypothetical protein WBW48_12750, partial [Anaerolineae bacterium]
TLVAFAAKRQLKLLLRTSPKFLPPTDGAMRHGRLAMTNVTLSNYFPTPLAAGALRDSYEAPAE